MNRTPIVAVLTALLATQLFCAQQTPTPAPSTIGQVEKIQGGVQAGPESSLADVESMRDMYNNDAVHVFDNGKANLDFGYGLTFTLYNDTIGGGTSVISDGTSHQAALKLSEGGLKGYNPTGSRTTVQLPSGVNIRILGTHYFITYDPVEDKIWVYNFDGTLHYQLPGGDYQLLFSRSLVEIKNGQVIRLYEGLSFSIDDFDARATTLNSPIQAVEEMLGGISIPVTGGETSTPTDTPTVTPTNTSTPTDTPTKTPTPTPIPCYLARFVKDVTIPDGSSITPYTYFTKTWRLKNEGSCAWDSRYQLVYVSGTPMSNAKTFPLNIGTVGYSDSVDVSVNLISPRTPGIYQGNFMLLAPDGTYIGLGAENKEFWVRILVDSPNSPPAVPGIVSPQQGAMVYCGSSASLDWSIPYDDTGVVEYEVMLEKWPLYCYTWCSAFNAGSLLVTSDSLDITSSLECEVPYRWAVRARDTDGAWSGWSEWIYFKVLAYVK